MNGECRACQPGFGCDRETGRLSRCAADTYSSAAGVCVACGANSHSAAGVGSEDECACDRGYVRNEDRRCVPCEPGTVFSDDDEDAATNTTAASCVPCPAGEYCLDRLHHEPCPEDMFSHEGSVVCSACRMNSGCAGVRHRGSATRCIDQANCTCDDGFVDHGGECRRCPASTMKPLLRRRDAVTSWWSRRGASRARAEWSAWAGRTSGRADWPPSRRATNLAAPSAPAAARSPWRDATRRMTLCARPRRTRWRS